MSLKEKNYKPRLIDEKIERYLKIFRALSIEGPKWCGKTWTSLAHANSAVYLTDPNQGRMAKIEPKNILYEKHPKLIDEWQMAPSIRDIVKIECDKGKDKGKFILTSSTALSLKKRLKEVHDSGVGRFALMHMHTMSLYETGDSTGKVSITDMYNNKGFAGNTGEVDIYTIADLIIRGGYPEAASKNPEEAQEVIKDYIDTILKEDITNEGIKRDKSKMKMLLNSLSRYESKVVPIKTLVEDIKTHEKGDLLTSRTTMYDYLDLLNRLYLIEDQEPYTEYYKYPKRICKSPKRHLCDTSLAVACLNLNHDMIIHDFKTFRSLFESLVLHDLRIYMEYLDGKIYYLKDNVSGLEADAVLEFKGSDYALVKIKLSYNEVNDGIKSLQKLSNLMTKKPKFMVVIIGSVSAAYKDPETGVYVVPITALKP